MEKNKIMILKKDQNRSEVIINGQIIKKVLDFAYKKNSAGETAEFTLKIDADEIQEIFKQMEV